MFLLPSVLIRHEHLTRRDVRAIKGSLCSRMGLASFFTAALLFIFDIVLLLALGSSTSWRQIEVYGEWSFIGHLSGAIAGLIVMGLQISARVVNNPKTTSLLSRIGIDLLYAAAAVEMILMILPMRRWVSPKMSKL